MIAECSPLLCAVLMVFLLRGVNLGVSYIAFALFLNPVFFTLTTSRVSTEPAVEKFDDFEDKFIDGPRGGDETVFEK